MNKRTKIWLGVGTFALAQMGPGLLHKADLLGHSGLVPLAWAAEGGEGESGEGGAVASDERFLTQLGLVQGHLLVGIELYRQGARGAAQTHMKHPGDELYTDLEPALDAHKADGFAEQLTKLADAVAAGASAQDVDNAYVQVAAKINAARAKITEPNPAYYVKAIAALVRTAGEEYEIGVKDGKISNVHEYQDAYGFVQVAHQYAHDLKQSGAIQDQQVLAQLESELHDLSALWPVLIPTGSEKLGDAADLHAAAARIELKANVIK